MQELLAGRYRMEYDGAQFRLSTDSMVLADFAVFSPVFRHNGIFFRFFCHTCIKKSARTKNKTETGRIKRFKEQ